MLKDFKLNRREAAFRFTSNQRLYIIITLILLAAFVLVFYAFPPYGSGGASDKVVKITFADNISEAQQKVIDLFNSEHRGQIEVVPINLPFSKFSTNERKELLVRYFRSKSDRIDVFSVDQIWVPRFAKWCEPLDRYITGEQTGMMTKYAAHTCYNDNALVAVPFYLDITVMYYRKDLIGALPNSEYWSDQLAHSISWQDLFRLRKEMRGSRPFFVFQAAPYEGLSCIYIELLANMNEQISMHDSLRLETPEAEKALQFLVDMVRRHNISPQKVVDFDEDESYQFFFQNDGVFLRAWPGFSRNETLRKNFPVAFSDCAVAPLPHLSGSSPAFVFGGWNLMISKFSTKMAEAIEFVHFLLGKESQELMYEYGGCLPTNDSVYSDTSFVAKHPELKFYQNLFRYGVYRPFSKKYTKVSDILSYYLNLAIRGRLSPKEALKYATSKINSVVVPND
ncbi:MAG TPA: extracellular solute-binding protein [Candidatus Acidoferrales bacterium]|nr:extracellular solute-binding protein [Candidatus Acidoferrales bacterium]